MKVRLFSKNIKICSYFDLTNSFLRFYEIKSQSIDEIVFVKGYNGISRFHEDRKVVYVNYKENAYQNLIYFLRNAYAINSTENLILHASAISKDNKNAIVFIGPPSSGKTTILRKSLDFGYSYIAEDLLFIKDEFCYLSPAFKIMDISKIAYSARIEKMFYINFKYGSKLVLFEMDIEDKKRAIFESLYNTRALVYNFETFKKLLEIPLYYTMYSNCEDLLRLF
ncbi:MAG: ATP-binding protein [candidate division WOR-3 bacterium]|nr:ATP-binding protein [candidate division WOR-3 bacterium]MCX7947339.1 ATP-binding protein [candidate division WOR-3 bacterium]MDW8150105.1 hypothetical protein [candidate division WOR-3 bacterium]